MEVRQKSSLPIITDPKDSARAVGLRYVNDDDPGIRRVRAGKTFRYLDDTGNGVRDEATLKRIKSLAIPPAWEDVWICPLENGHLQATGRDARGRKQYRYHPKWREIRDETKFTRMILFGKALPRIRQQVQRDMKAPGLERRKVLATIVRLLELTYIRVGNEEYARDNKSYGLTTLKDKHAKVNGSSLKLEFRGKSAKEHSIDVRDPELARIVKKCQELPGQELLQYIDDEGCVQDVKSENVNEYLREISGEDFTAKDFRTWAGTVLAAKALCDSENCQSKKHLKKNITRAVETVAHKLGNTPSVCRKCYVHPAVFDSYQDGSIGTFLKQRDRKVRSKPGKLPPEEASVLCLLETRLKLAQEPLLSKLRRSVQARGKQRMNANAH